MSAPDPAVGTGTEGDAADVAVDVVADGAGTGAPGTGDRAPGTGDGTGEGPSGAADAVVDAAPGTTSSLPGPPGDGAPDFRMALVSSITVDLPNQHPAVCLREIEMPRRQLTFSVGLQDGIALSHAMRRIPTPRPLTHELMSGVLQRFDIDLVAVRIVGRTGTVHFAELDLQGTTGRSVLSCRPTDALILALHHPVQVPILVDARLLESGDDLAPPAIPA